MIAVLVLIIVLGGVAFIVITIWLVKSKSKTRSPSHDTPVEMESNPAYGPVVTGRGGGGARSVEEERHGHNDEGMKEPEYEVIYDVIMD